MSFDLVAPVYDALSRAIFGQSLEQAQLLLLPKIPADASVLIVGGGTGFSLAEVLTRCQPSHILFLEASEKMLIQARRRVTHHPLVSRVEFRHGTEADLRSDEAFRVVMLPFVLDLSTEPVLRDMFLPPLFKVTVPGGCWIVTDFINSPRLHHRILLKTMYTFFRLVSGIKARQLPDWQRLLAEAGLIPSEQHIAAGGQVQTTCLMYPGGAAGTRKPSNA